MDKTLGVEDLFDYGINVQAVVAWNTSLLMYQDQDCNQDIEQESAACGIVNSFSNGLKLSLSLLLDCFSQSP